MKPNLPLAIYRVGRSPTREMVQACAVGVATAAFGAGTALFSRGNRWPAVVALIALGLPLGWAIGPHLHLDPAPPSRPIPVADGSPVDAQTIYDRMRAAYAHAGSYQDRGTVYRDWHERLGRRREVASFTTAFVRNGGFAFDYRYRFQVMGNIERYLVWSDGKNARSWWSIPNSAKLQDLGSMLSSMSGVTENASSLVPSLLLQGMRSRITDSRSLSLAGRERVDGAAADVLDLNSLRLWVDASSYQVLRVASTNTLDDGDWVETTISYSARFDRPIPSALLDVHPDAEAKWSWLDGTNRIGFVFVGLSLLGTLVIGVRRKLAGKSFRPKSAGFDSIRAGFEAVLSFLAIIAVSVGFVLAGVSTGVALNNLMIAIFAVNASCPFIFLARRPESCDLDRLPSATS